MGTDIRGVFESIPDDPERGSSYICDLLGFVDRSYPTFASLFGVRNRYGFDPLFDHRGLPDRRGFVLDGKLPDPGEREPADAWGATYCTRSELRAVDWDATLSARAGRYRVLDEDGEPTGETFVTAEEWAAVIDANRDRLAAGDAVPNEDGTRYIDQPRWTRRETLSPAWDWVIFDLLESFARRWDPRDVRLTVWFDS